MKQNAVSYVEDKINGVDGDKPIVDYNIHKDTMSAFDILIDNQETLKQSSIKSLNIVS